MKSLHLNDLAKPSIEDSKQLLTANRIVSLDLLRLL